MGERHHYFIVLSFLMYIFIGCSATSTGVKPSPFQIPNSLPQNKLAYYNDPFDKLRQDLWEKAGKTFSEAQLTNYKPADMDLENGKLRIKTRVGHFSKGGLVSNYTLRGDFDVQIDCEFDFIQKTLDMEQSLIFAVVKKGEEFRQHSLANIGLSKRAGRNSTIFSKYIEKGKLATRKWVTVDRFRGTLRIVRIGNKINTLYRSQGEKDWKTILTFTGMTDEVSVAFGLQNFTSTRTSIRAETSIVARFDNFKINAAQGVIEEEI